MGRDDENLVLLWGMDAQNTTSTAYNSALSTGALYDAPIIDNTALWRYLGVFCRIWAAVRNTAVETRNAPVSRYTWNHIAAAYETH